MPVKVSARRRFLITVKVSARRRLFTATGALGHLPHEFRALFLTGNDTRQGQRAATGINNRQSQRAATGINNRQSQRARRDG